MPLDFSPLVAIPSWAKYVYRVGSQWRGNVGRKLLALAWSLLCLTFSLFVIAVPFSIFDSEGRGGSFWLALVLTLFGYLVSFPYLKARRLVAGGISDFLTLNELPSRWLGGMQYSVLLPGRSRVYKFSQYNQYIRIDNDDRFKVRISELTIEYPQQLPHIVLDATGNDRSLSSLTTQYSERQHISLEGDFDTYFRLYAPQGFQTDALSIMSPDVMQTLIDSSSDFDVEIKGNRVAVRTIEFVGFESMTLQAMLKAMDALCAEVEHRLKSWQGIHNVKELQLIERPGNYTIKLFGWRLPFTFRWLGYITEAAPFVSIGLTLIWPLFLVIFFKPDDPQAAHNLRLFCIIWFALVGCMLLLIFLTYAFLRWLEDRNNHVT